VHEWIEELVVAHAGASRDLVRPGNLADLLGGVAVGAEGDADTGAGSTADEALVGAVAVRDLEGDASAGERGDRALFARLGPELLERLLPEGHREEGRVGEDVDGHLGGKALEILDVRVHVILGIEPGRPRAGEGVQQGAVGKEDRVEAADAVGEAGREIVRQLAPELVVPAELSTAEDVVAFELVEVGANLGHRVERTADVARAMISDARPDSAGAHLGDELFDREDAVRESRVGVEVHEHRAT